VNERLKASKPYAREGTNAIHYSKGIATERIDVVLPEQRDFITRYVPTITGDIEPHLIRLLPLEKSSRVGAGITRKRPSDAGVTRSQQRCRLMSLLLAEQVSVCSSPDEDDGAALPRGIVRLVDQQEIAADMTLLEDHSPLSG
jgi:hypothetical protein